MTLVLKMKISEIINIHVHTIITIYLFCIAFTYLTPVNYPKTVLAMLVYSMIVSMPVLYILQSTLSLTIVKLTAEVLLNIFYVVEYLCFMLLNSMFDVIKYLYIGIRRI